ncbi:MULTISPECIES: hypothetical protein [Rhodococcus]|uniref:hypothetical protein n=1 Tax=Rhodococcus TaxID=1827 RepID=UPI00193C4599|nr:MULTISPECIES: hypothetical protein [Rhodococcus]QRI74847.1 hypothetical protein JQ505_20050 [Rhodococcus aetherivorans]QSE58257.1 hypothetical protein JYA75_21155 [Rhodococcus sp. PSBB066]QSE70421.1 hypothetical protein JYA91_06475 [Rhodococcus sp. PSBB049]
MKRRQFTPETEAWLEETLSRRKPPTVAQLDVIKPLFRQAARARQEEQRRT